VVPGADAGAWQSAVERQVAVVITGIETYGIQSFLLTQLRRSAQSGLHFSYLAAQDGDCAKALRAAGAQVEVMGGRIQRHYPGHPLLVPLFWLWWWPDLYRTYSGIRRRLRTTRYDIVYVHSHYGLVISRLAARGTRCPVVCHLHGSLNMARLGGLQRILVSLILAVAADRLVANSDFAATTLWEPARRKAKRIYTGVDIQAIAEMVRGTAKDPRRIVIVGRLAVVKKQELAIQAIAILRGRGVDCTLEIIGGHAHTDPTSDHEPMLKKLTAKLGIGDQVHFLGAVSPPYNRIAAAAALVSCSTRESFGLVVVEAAACGTAVVVADKGATAELVEDGKTGLLFSADDPVSLADALQKLLNDEALRGSLVEAARRRALARYGITEHLLALRSCFDVVVNQS
jgi:glycosyltransferase involved in cell wall biosynthesis